MQQHGGRPLLSLLTIYSDIHKLQTLKSTSVPAWLNYQVLKLDMSEFKHTEEILHLYKAPFKYDGMGYIWDANGKMIADSIGESVPAFAQVRGWGYLTGMGQGGSAIPHDIAEEIQDEIGHMMAEALTEYWHRIKNRDE